MAHPLFIAEQAMKSFIGQWLSGLQPSISLTTRSDGSIIATSEVTSTSVIKIPIRNQSAVSLFPRRSGKNARYRRKFKRTAKINSNASRDPQTISEEQAEHLPVTREMSIHVDKSVQAVSLSADSACETEPFPVPRTLTTTKLAPLSIPPKVIYHPAIINATQSFYQKHPSELSKKEMKELKFYHDQKQARGQPVEEDLIYLPTFMRNCL